LKESKREDVVCAVDTVIKKKIRSHTSKNNLIWDTFVCSLNLVESGNSMFDSESDSET